MAEIETTPTVAAHGMRQISLTAETETVETERRTESVSCTNPRGLLPSHSSKSDKTDRRSASGFSPATNRQVGRHWPGLAMGNPLERVPSGTAETGEFDSRRYHNSVHVASGGLIPLRLPSPLTPDPSPECGMALTPDPLSRLPEEGSHPLPFAFCLLPPYALPRATLHATLALRGPTASFRRVSYGQHTITKRRRLVAAE